MRTADVDAALLGSLHPCDCTLYQNVLFECRYRAEYGVQKPTPGCTGVEALGQRAKMDATVPKVLCNAEQMRQRPSEPVEFPDHQRVTAIFATPIGAAAFLGGSDATASIATTFVTAQGVHKSPALAPQRTKTPRALSAGTEVSKIAWRPAARIV